MKLAARDAAGFFARLDPALAGVLLYGGDADRVARQRTDVIDALIGADGAGEMRLARLLGSELRRDPAALSDATRSSGFFAGPRAVLVEEAGDGQAKLFAEVLSGWCEGDARIVATAGTLGRGSALRKTFESGANAVAMGIYADPPGRSEIAAALTRSGIDGVAADAMDDLEALAQALEPGEFERLLDKLALYKAGAAGDVDASDIAACAPVAPEAELDRLIMLAVDGQASRLVGELRRMSARSGAATALTVAAARYFRVLHAAAIAPGGPESALSRARPPVFGPRRSQMAAAARGLGPERIEMALAWIMDAELRLRSGRPTPGQALVERLMVRIARLKGR